MLEKSELFSQEIIKKLQAWELRYPKDQKRSVILPGLHVLQDEHGGFLTTELMDKLALYLDVPAPSVYEVATFYSMYDLEKVGRHKLNVCTNVSCMLNGAKKLFPILKTSLALKLVKPLKMVELH